MIVYELTIQKINLTSANIMKIGRRALLRCHKCERGFNWNDEAILKNSHMMRSKLYHIECAKLVRLI